MTRTFKLRASIAAGVYVSENGEPEHMAIYMGAERGTVVDVRGVSMDSLGWPQEVQSNINAHFKKVFDLEHEKRADMSKPSPRAVYVDSLQPWTVEVTA